MEDLIKQYQRAKKGKKDSRLKSIPSAFKPKIVDKDYKRGYIIRRFAQKVNDDFSPIIEISESNLNKISINSLYRVSSFKWRISGTKEEIKNSNRNIITENSKKMPQLKNRLVNLIEYCNEFKTT